ncbi:MAG: LysR family transcriptional regulator [Granulosicoccus sp.]
MHCAQRATMIDLRRVRYFLALCESLNYSRAARALSISQPALTKSIIRLEADLGGKLLRRVGKNTHLTPLGKAMKSQFQELEQAAGRAAALARQMINGTSSQLRIAVTCTVGPRRIISFLSGYRQKHPHIEVSIRDALPDDLIELLLNGTVDCALVPTSIDNEERLRLLTLYEEPMVVVHPTDHPFFARGSVTLKEVMCQPFVDHLQCEFRSRMMNDMLKDGVAPEYAVRCDREEWIQALVLAGQGVALAPAETFLMEGLAVTPLDTDAYTRQVALAIPAGHEDNPVIRSFMNSARSYGWQHEPYNQLSAIP